MTAERPVRRSVTAREAAERFGVSERSIRRIAAEPREQYLTRAAVRRQQAADLAADGLPWTEIAERMDTTEAAVKRLVWRHQKKQEKSKDA